jgi:glycosyltransferase involved in cell wall biosynthesis
MPIRDRKVVVHVVGQLQVGGMEKLLVEFARHADRERYSLHFVNLGDRGVIAEELEELGWPVTSLDVGTGLRPWVILELARRFRNLGASVVHTHNSRALLYGGPAARLAGARVVIHTRHGQEFGISARLARAVRWATRSADKAVCVSKDSADSAREQGIPERKICTILNGIDLSRFRPALPGSSGPIVSVGRLSPEKDFATLVRAAAIAVEKDASFRLEIAGDGPAADSVRGLVAELKLGHAVTLLGQVKDIPSLLARGSIFTLSSLTEGVSLTLLEAMASGLPVVATRVGGNPEVVDDGVTGLLVPPADPPLLAAALLALWGDPRKREELGRAGRARVEALFDVRNMVAAYEELYRRFDRSGRGTRPQECAASAE